MPTSPTRASSLSRCAAAALLTLGIAFAAPDAGAVPDVGFPDGVASGDVTSDSAVLWTRVDRQTPIKVEVSERADFKGKEAFKQTLHPSPSDDLTLNVLATGLAPGTTYSYRFRHGSAASEVGTFRTAPAPESGADVSFAYSGDSDSLHQFVDGNNFEVLDAIASEPDLDFWVYLGDTIYSDSSVAGDPAMTLDEYRDVYRANRALAALPNLLKALSTYVIWDDHEVQNDFDGQTVDPTRYANGRKAFFEYNPLMEIDLLEDPTCAGDPLFRTFTWGSDVEVFVLDERSCRSADAQPACGAELVPTLPNLSPPLDFRSQFRAQLAGAGAPAPVVDALIPLAAAPACLAAINDSARTMLGPVQKQALFDALAGSPARFKIIVNGLPIQQFWALPYDRWEGYAAERTELLRFIRDHVSGHTIFLTTDTHANLVNDVRVDRFFEPQSIAVELITGPIATFTFAEELANFPGLPPGFAVPAFHQILDLAGVVCRNLDTDSYGRVDVDAGFGTATIDLKDANGNLVRNSNPFDPGNTDPCGALIGP